jgi:hypothetical protein
MNRSQWDSVQMDKKDKEEGHLERFGKVRRSSLSRKIADRRKVHTKKPEIKESPKLDLGLLEARVREELYRQLGKKLQKDDLAPKDQPQLDLKLLEARIREELSRQLGKSDEVSSAEGDRSDEFPLDKDMLEEAVREAMHLFLGKDKSRTADPSQMDIDPALLESRVREELYQKLGKEMGPDQGEGEEAGLPDRAILEARIREEIAKQVKGVVTKGTVKVNEDWKSRIDLDLLESQIREVLKKCLYDFPFASEWKLSDEDLEEIIDRTLK